MLIGAFYAPSPTPADARAARAYAAAEKSLGITLDQPADWQQRIAAAAAKGELAEVWGGVEGRFARLLGLSWRPLASPPMIYALLEVSDSSDMVSHAEDVVDTLAEALSAFWAVFSTEATAGTVALQIEKPGGPPPPLGLPGLKLDRQLPRSVPQRLGWINYWSTEAAAAIGFSEPSQVADVVFRFRKTESGYLLRLTNEPLDLGREDHVEIVKAMYNRFPAIGGRNQ